MVFSPINHHNHNNHWAVLGFCWVSSVMLFCVESELFDLKVCGETGNNSCRSWQSLCGLWFTAIWIVFYFNIQIRKFLPALLSVFDGNQERKIASIKRIMRGRLTLIVDWALASQSWLMFVPAGCGSANTNTARQLGLTTHPPVGCVTAPNSG